MDWTWSRGIVREKPTGTKCSNSRKVGREKNPGLSERNPGLPVEHHKQ